MYHFFMPNEEELSQVIRSSLCGQDEITGIHTIKTGWTNITMDAQGEKNSYIFRFPRNRFFADMITKDCAFCSFVTGKTHIPVPKMALLFHQGRPFSCHVKIKGCALDQRMNQLSPDERNNIAADVALFLTDLHRLPPQSMPADIRESLNDFLINLASVHNGDYDARFHQAFAQMEQNPIRECIVHGDFHPGNILIDDDNRICGIIDFAFASLSDYHADLGRFVGRSEEKLAEAVIQAYQDMNHTVCDRSRIQTTVELFHYVEYKYVQYMQASHPEITIPDSVLQMSANYAKNCLV